MEWFFGGPESDRRGSRASRGGRSSIRRKSRMSGDSYNVYDEQNEIRGAEMLEKYRQMHSGEHDDLDVRPSEFARDNPITRDTSSASRSRRCRTRRSRSA